MSNSPSAKGSAHASPCTYADVRVARAEARAVVEPERGDPLRPRVVLLEEVQRPAAVALAEPELVGADVEHGRLRRRAQLVEEEPQLALARAEGDRSRRAASRGSIRSAGAGRLAPMVEAVLRATGPVLAPPDRRNGDLDGPPARASAGRPRISCPTDASSCARRASAPSTRRASCSRSTTTRASSTDGFARDPLLGPTVQRLRGMRPRRKATVTHAAIRAVSGQLIQASRALAIERAIIRACGEDPPTREALARALPRASDRLRSRREPRGDADAAREDARSRGAARTGRRARSARPRARRRPVDGRRDRAPGSRPLRRRSRRRPRRS